MVSDEEEASIRGYALTIFSGLIFCPIPCNPMDCIMSDFAVHHQLLELTQTDVHRVGDAIQPSQHLSSPSPPAFNPLKHNGLFKWVSSSPHGPKYWGFSQHQFFQWIFRMDLLSDRLDGSPCSLRESQEFSSTPHLKSIDSSVLRFFFYRRTLTSIHDY